MCNSCEEDKVEEIELEECASKGTLPSNIKGTLPSNIKGTVVENCISIPKNFNFGYACLNTELRKNKPAIFTSRTLRLATLQEKGFSYLKSLIDQNLKDLLTQLQWNVKHQIFFMRLSSEIFPFASHPEHGYSIDFAKETLKTIGDYAKENKIRLTMHPGQYNVLSSPNENVVKNTFLDLNHHNQILDMMGLDQNSVIIIHGGGVYGNKQKALERLEENISLLPENTRNRLVLENCEMSYCVKDLLPISEKLQVPIVLDFHHDSIYPSDNPVEFYFKRVFAVWFSRNIKPKVHVSNSVPGITEKDSKTARRKHSDYIQFLHQSLLTITFPIDVMLECKMKEQAIFRLLETNKR
jgi:UV DNA damage endonuclease